MILYGLTLGLIAAIVLVVAGYLVAIALTLARARRNVSKLADALEAVADGAEPLEARLGEIGGALGTAAGSLDRTDQHLGGAADACGL